MAAPPNLPSFAHLDAQVPAILLTGPLAGSPFMPNALNVEGPHEGVGQHPSNGSHSHSPLPPTLPPFVPARRSPTHQIQNDTATNGGQTVEEQHEEEAYHSSDESDRDSEDSGDEDERESDPHRWRPLEEDKSQPCEDEMEYIKSKDEHSALDHVYWEQETFFDLQDPELIAGEHGRIDWLVDGFNGTKDNPNKETVMRSPIVRIGGYDWRIKFYPRGNDTDYLSIYLECTTMQSAEFEEFEDFAYLPIPFHSDIPKPRRRRSIAVQLSVVMYNPAEPRTYEYHADAHQFNKQSADYGWTRFTRFSRHDFMLRAHGQRQAILRDDKLAFSAYIRLVHDPTGCMWAHGSNPYEDSLHRTGCRPFSPLHPLFSADIILLHFTPFRKFVQESTRPGSFVSWMQVLLYKMMARKRSGSAAMPEDSGHTDTVFWLLRALRLLNAEKSQRAVRDILRMLPGDEGVAIGSSRLKTKMYPSVQAAINARPTALSTPALLWLELERHEFYREKRKWRKLTNHIDMQDNIVVGGVAYTLFAFSTHCGDLSRNIFNFYIRPRGVGHVWYAYTDGRVACLTHKQAVDKHCGIARRAEHKKKRRSSGPRSDPPHRPCHLVEEEAEVAHVVFYVRDDVRDGFDTSMSVVEDVWDVPEYVKRCDINSHLDKDVTSSEQTTDTPDAEKAPPSSSSSSSSDNSGSATPNIWLMDGEDVVMSDTDGESEHVVNGNGHDSGLSSSHPTSSSPLPTTFGVLDHLGSDYYEGHLLRDARPHGHGHLISMSGDEYTGAFHLGRFHGHGTMTYAATGNTYTGAWEAGLPHGTGKFVEAATGNVYDGGWTRGKKSGRFVLSGTVTDEDEARCSICYERDINTAFYDCGHVVACKECAGRIDSCPVCRRRVLNRLQLFGVKVSFE